MTLPLNLNSLIGLWCSDRDDSFLVGGQRAILKGSHFRRVAKGIALLEHSLYFCFPSFCLPGHRANSDLRLTMLYRRANAKAMELHRHTHLSNITSHGHDHIEQIEHIPGLHRLSNRSLLAITLCFLLPHTHHLFSLTTFFVGFGLESRTWMSLAHFVL